MDDAHGATTELAGQLVFPDAHRGQDTARGRVSIRRDVLGLSIVSARRAQP
jgi:hypothetical protein